MSQTLFEGEPNNSLDGDLIDRLQAAYQQQLLDNPPTPTFMETNPRHEAAARYASKRDVQRFLGVLNALGLRIAAQAETEAQL